MQEKENVFAADLAKGLFPVLAIVAHSEIMLDRIIMAEVPSAATWGSVLDGLANYVWFYQKAPGFCHS